MCSDHDSRAWVSLGSKVLAANGHSDFIWGHVSIRDPAGRGAWMKRSAIGFEEVDEDDVLLVGFDGEVIVGEGRRHAEWPIHTEILRSRPDVGAVVHSHAPHCVAIGAADQPLRPVSHAATLFVPPEVPRFSKTSDLVVTTEMGAAVAQSLADSPAAMMINHGMVAVGVDVPAAVIRAILLEKACEHQVLTTAAGGVKLWTGDEAALAKRPATWSDAHLQQLWAYLVRRLS